MNVRFDLSNSTLTTETTEQQAMVDGINKFLASLPDYEDSTVARRLAMGLLESADVAPQRELAEAAGFSQDRSVRVYQERLKEQGLAGLFNRPISGRPAITTQTPVEKAFIQVVLAAVIEEHARRRRLGGAREPGVARPGGGSGCDGVYGRNAALGGAFRLPLQQAFGAAATQTAEPGPVQLGRTQVGGAFVQPCCWSKRLVETGGGVADGARLMP